MLGGRHERGRIAQTLLDACGDVMKDEDRKLVGMLATCNSNVMSRFRLLVDRNLWCASWRTNISSRVAILFGWY